MVTIDRSDNSVEKRQCKAHSKRTGERCKRAPVAGADVCTKHGGGAPQVQAAAARRIAQQKAESDANAILAYFGGKVTNPYEMLASIAAEILATKDALAARVNALEDIQIIDKTGVAHLSPIFQAFDRFLDKAAAIGDKMVRLGIQAEWVRLEQEKAEPVLNAFWHALDVLWLGNDQRNELAQRFVEALRPHMSGDADTLTGEVVDPPTTPTEEDDS